MTSENVLLSKISLNFIKMPDLKVEARNTSLSAGGKVKCKNQRITEK